MCVCSRGRHIISHIYIYVHSYVLNYIYICHTYILVLRSQIQSHHCTACKWQREWVCGSGYAKLTQHTHTHTHTLKNTLDQAYSRMSNSATNASVRATYMHAMLHMNVDCLSGFCNESTELDHNFKYFHHTEDNG